jgi:hypothetical protein
VLASAGPPRPWAQDPEALLLFTFEVARSDPRLFDEVLDWLLINEKLVSLRRLRSLAVDSEDKALNEAVIAWLGRELPKGRFGSTARPRSSPTLEPLFFHERFPIVHRDDTFAEYGWLRPAFAGTRKARPPDVDAPINLSFRLRHLLGVGAHNRVARPSQTQTSGSGV